MSRYQSANIASTDLTGRLDLLQQYFQDYVVSGKTAPISKKEAAAYISYNTLNSDDINPGVQWTAVAAMIGARFTFSNFTLNAIAKLGLETTYRKTHNIDDDLVKKGRLIEFRNAVATANISLFKLPPDNANCHNETDNEHADEHARLLPGYGNSSEA
jgi:hypothetical protein